MARGERPNALTSGPPLLTRVTRKVEIDTPLIECVKTISAAEKAIYNQINEHVGTFISDGCTLQVGVGKLRTTCRTSARVEVYSEMIGDWAMRLNAERIVGAFALGSNAFYQWLNSNVKVEMVPLGEICHPSSFAQISNLVSINSAYEVDLTGQVASEGIAYEHHTGTGGSNDFTAGASYAKKGVSIIALPSITKTGASRIVSRLHNVVTISRADVDYIVTEYGIAEMRFRTLGERVKALISIAHPMHRQELRPLYESIRIALKRILWFWRNDLNG